ncbi:MAG: hypothetical protein JNM46_06700 [Anaerolineales bacterium]|nr:hypothetical protein [Anaerolineales bacterium]
MKNMQDFHNWLSVREPLLLEQIRLRALTGVSRTRLAKVSNEAPWFIWDAPQSLSE